MPTPHCEAKEGEIASTVIVCGDPLRAQYIAEKYFSDARCYNKVRGMLGFTGTYKGKRVSVQGHGMGIPSIGIYTYELYNFYGVENIIRAGSSGSLDKDVHLMDVVLAMGACTDSNYGSQYKLPGTFAPIADYGLLSKAVGIAAQKDISVKVGNVLSTDVFYNNMAEELEWNKMGVLCVEMELSALYMNAARAGKKALGILTISDELITHNELTSLQREQSFDQMIGLALDLAVQI
jgi:purine-nucleoside phosphorylase